MCLHFTKKSSILLSSKHDWLIERSCENLDGSKFIYDFGNYFTLDLVKLDFIFVGILYVLHCHSIKVKIKVKTIIIKTLIKNLFIVYTTLAEQHKAYILTTFVLK